MMAEVTGEGAARAGDRSLADFAGRWRLSREITHGDGSRATFEGVAEWRPDPRGLAYRESGTLTMEGGGAFHAERAYLWKPDLSVWFTDGRFFHQVPPRGGETGHWCDPDRYDGRYDFAGWPAFTVRWRVTGPRKSYRMLSRYTRGGAA